MTAFTHAFVNKTRRIVELAEFAKIARTDEVWLNGFVLISDMDRIRLDQHGRPCRNAGGWSYGHIQHGHICAGAGGLNSLPLMPVSAA
jgi:hypothetical protein